MSCLSVSRDSIKVKQCYANKFAIFPQKEELVKCTYVIPNFNFHILYKAGRSKIFTKILPEQKIFHSEKSLLLLLVNREFEIKPTVTFLLSKKITFGFISNSLFICFIFICHVKLWIDWCFPNRYDPSPRKQLLAIQ